MDPLELRVTEHFCPAGWFSTKISYVCPCASLYGKEKRPSQLTSADMMAELPNLAPRTFGLEQAILTTWPGRSPFTVP